MSRLSSQLRDGLTPAVLVCVTLLLVPVRNATGQVTVTTTDLLNLIGTAYQLTFDDSTAPTVDLGGSGANQIWDFSSLTPAGGTADYSFLSPDTTPYFSFFPEADLTLSASLNGPDTAQVYQYIDIGQDVFQELGVVFITTDPDTTIIDSTQTPSTVPIPLEYLDTFYDVERDTIGTIATSAIVYTDSTFSTIDAWGMLTTPLGTYEALRNREEERHTEDTYSNGVMVSTSTSVTYRFEWISPDFLVVLSINGPHGGGDPNFTTAESYQIISAVATNAESPEFTERETPEIHIYPNPFRSTTTIHVSASPHRPAQVEVMDLLGRTVSVLHTEPLRAPATLAWDGTDASGRRLASGLYLIVVRTDRGVATRSAVLVN